MNTANLQLEGLYTVLAALLKTLREKEILSASEIEAALDEAQSAVTSDACRTDALSPANVDAVCFPIRLLKIANASGGETPLTFSELATAVGQLKPDR